MAYSVEYQEGPCRVEEPPLPSLSVEIPCGGTALQVMENAVDAPQVGRMYRFAATYFGSSLGYFINAINSIPPVIEPLTNESCFWYFLIRSPDGTVLPSSVGVSSFTISRNGYGMIMRYSAQTVFTDHEMNGNGTRIDSTGGVCSSAISRSAVVNSVFLLGMVLVSISHFLFL